MPSQKSAKAVGEDGAETNVPRNMRIVWKDEAAKRAQVAERVRKAIAARDAGLNTTAEVS